jgi:iron complex outermembrane receptor protein
VHEGTFRYEIGNTELNEESSFQTDAGILYETEHMNCELAGFVNYIQNYIFIEKLSSLQGGDSIPDPSDPVPAYKFVQGNSILFGGEITLDIHPHPLDWLHFENSFAYVRGMQFNQPDSTRNLPQMPAPRFQTELRGDLDNWGNKLKNLFAFVEWQYTFPQNFIYFADNTETPTPAYNILSAGFGGNLTDKKGRILLSFSFVAGNLFNFTYQDHLSRLKYLPENEATGRKGVFNMGRNFSFNLTFPLVFKNS